jgi:hypothetical protein
MDRQMLKMRVGMNFHGCSVQQLAEYMYRPEAVQRWLGSDVALAPRKGFRVVLPAQGGVPRRQRVIGLRGTSDRHELIIVEDTSTQDPPGMLTLRITARPDGLGCRLRVIEENLPNRSVVEARVEFWQEALNRLVGLTSNIGAAREKTQQALVIVHGIGEQLPGQTLRAFVKAVFRPEGQPARETGELTDWVKPDYTSSLFEMRKMTVRGTAEMPTTDVYELYWAHLMGDTSVGQVTSWLLRLVFRPLRRIPEPLRRHIIGIWVLIGALLVAAVLQFFRLIPVPAGIVLIVGTLGTLVVFVWRSFLSKAFIHFLGDAARYLEPKPENIARRQEIRQAGVDLLENLHGSGKYDRVIMFGHSLGSVIAYDVLSLAWIRLGRRHNSPSTARSSALAALESILPHPPEFEETDAERIKAALAAQDLQHAAWKEHRSNALPWLVTDLVTVGSPLTYANLLLGLDRETDFKALTEERVFPTCPPATENRPSVKDRTPIPVFSYAESYRDVATRRHKTIVLPHHAALFAVTRWTNLYFPFSGFVNGDPVGGPLHRLLGRWIVDIPLRHPGTGVLGFAHGLYWSDDTPSTAHIEVLRNALMLDSRQELQELKKSLPLFTSQRS